MIFYSQYDELYISKPKHIAICFEPFWNVKTLILILPSRKAGVKKLIP